MQSLFDRKGKVQVLFKTYNLHKQACIKALNSNKQHNISFFIGLQYKNNELIHEIETIIQEEKLRDGKYQPHLRIETALEQLLIFREEFSHCINPHQRINCVM